MFLSSYGRGPGLADDVSLQFSVVKSVFRENMSVGTIGDESSIGQQSALASFSPYYIDDKNIDIMNQLFDSDGMWKDINTGQANMHKVGAALEHDSLDGDESSTKTGRSSLTDFWDAMNKRYNYPSAGRGPGSRQGSRQRQLDIVTSKSTDSKTRSRLQEATLAGKRAERLLAPPSNEHMSPTRRRGSPMRPYRLSPDTITTKKKLPASAWVGDSLARLDPLSMNVTTALRTYVKEQRKRSDGVPVGGDDVSILLDVREGAEKEWQDDMPTVQPPLQHTTPGDDYHNTDELGHDVDVSNTYFVSRVKATASNRTRIRAEKLRDMKFMRNFFVAKATMGDTQELIRKMQVCVNACKFYMHGLLDIIG